MKALITFVIFEAVLGTAVMFSDLASQAPGGEMIGWGVVVFSWLLVAVFHVVFERGEPNASA